MKKRCNRCKIIKKQEIKMEEKALRTKIIKLLDKYFQGIDDWEEEVENLVDGLVELTNYYNDNEDNFTVKTIKS